MKIIPKGRELDCSLADTNSPIVIDGDGHIAGRLCSNISKMLLNGQRVVIINAEKILISGSRKNIFLENTKRLEIGSIVNPKHGPFHPRRPDTYITKMIRGMLPRKKTTGIQAKKRLRVYISVPAEYEKIQSISVKNAKATKSLSYYTTIGELSSSTMGWENQLEIKKI